VATRFVPAPDAFETLSELAGPEIVATADALTPAVVGNVPVVDGVMQASYSPSVEETPEGARWHPGSPFWHWMEYGTAHSPAYRPIQLGVASLGLRFEPS